MRRRRRFDADEYPEGEERIFFGDFGVDEPPCPRGTTPESRLTLKRTACLPGKAKVKLNNSSAVAEFLVEHFSCEPQESIVVLGLSSRNHLLGVHRVSTGGFNATGVDPRVVFSGLLLMGAIGFILAHNHPSGDAEPSVEDIALTRQIQDAGRLLVMPLLDHIVVGAGGAWTSMNDRGLIPR